MRGRPPGTRNRTWTLTPKGLAAVTRYPCPGDNQRPCLAMTVDGRRCQFCTRTVVREALAVAHAEHMERLMPWGIVEDADEPTAEAMERIHRGVMERIAERRRDAG